jgi:hypothetical protein
MLNIITNGYEHYLITKDGKVYNSVSGRELKSYPNKNTGYYTVVLRNSIKPKCVYVHRLVAEAYIKNPLNLPEVNHINHNKADNSVSNLEWVTRKQNIQHRNKDGRDSIVFNSVMNNSQLLNEGIELYKKIGRIDVVAELWNVSYPTARKVLMNCNIEIYHRNLIPLYIKKELIEYCKLNQNVKQKQKLLINYAKSKYNIDLTRSTASSIVNNKESLFVISKKSKIIQKKVTQKTVLDFAFDI